MSFPHVCAGSGCAICAWDDGARPLDGRTSRQRKLHPVAWADRVRPRVISRVCSCDWCLKQGENTVELSQSESASTPSDHLPVSARTGGVAS